MEEKRMKTLEQVIARNDYKRISENLKERTEELARLICDKMLDLDLKEVMGYETRVYRSNISDETHLTVYNQEEGRYHSLEEINSDYRLHGDYNCRIIGANNSEALEFLNKVRSLITELDRIETEKTGDIQLALDATADL